MGPLSPFAKAIISLIMSIVAILAVYGVIVPDWLNEANVTAIIVALSPLLVYLIPNKPSQ